MIVAIVGSRDGVHLDVVQHYVEALHEKHPAATVISGGARGVDSVAEATAWKLGHEVVSLRPVEIEPEGEGGVTALYAIEQWLAGPNQKDSWENTEADYGTFTSFAAAASRRNHEVVKAAEVVVAFTSGSRGTAHAVSEARRLGRQLHLYDGQGGKL